MTTVAVIGAGEVGGATAQALASGDRVGRVLLVDQAAGVASGKALDIQQMGAIEGCHVRLRGTDDLSSVSGCAVCVIADRFGDTSLEWIGPEGLALVTRLAAYVGDAPILFAGAGQADLLSAAARDVRIPPARLLGSAAEAFRSAVAGVIAMEVACSPSQVSLGVLGAPGALVVPWSQASIDGYAVEHVLDTVQIARIEARVARLWPPGPNTLGTAAARTAEALLHSSRRTHAVLAMLHGEFGVRDRVGALPALLGPGGIVERRRAALTVRERVTVETSLGPF